MVLSAGRESQSVHDSCFLLCVQRCSGTRGLGNVGRVILITYIYQSLTLHHDEIYRVNSKILGFQIGGLKANDLRGFLKTAAAG